MLSGRSEARTSRRVVWVLRNRSWGAMAWSLLTSAQL